MQIYSVLLALQQVLHCPNNGNTPHSQSPTYTQSGKSWMQEAEESGITYTVMGTSTT